MVMPKRKTATICSMGTYVPEEVLCNKKLETMVDTSEEWIRTRTGMCERRVASAKESTSFMGAEAAKKALSQSSVSPDEVDLILVATITPDHHFPSTACLVQSHLNLPGVPAMDIQAACSGLLYGLSVAQSYIESGHYKNILLIAAEKLTSFVDYTDRNTCILFGDGAWAAVVSGKEQPGLGIEKVLLGADGQHSQLLGVAAGGCVEPASEQTVRDRRHYIHMDGKEVFKRAVRSMGEASETILQKLNLTKDHVRYFIPHQANLRIIKAMAQRLELSEEKIICNIHKYGNTSAASIGLALGEIFSGEWKNEDLCLLAAFGGGFTWGSAVLKYRGIK